MPLDEFMPHYEFGEVHSTKVFASPESALDAVERVTPGEIPLARLLFAIRSLPALFTGEKGLFGEKNVPIYEQMAGRFFTLKEAPGSEIVVGGVGQMWRPDGGGSPAFRNAEEFVSFRELGYAKVVLNFSVRRRSDHTVLCTETRVLMTDASSRRAFGLYWIAIRAGSGLIRLSWLRAAKRRAESGERAGMRSSQRV